LKFAASDADKISTALKQFCAFTVRKVAGRDQFAVMRALHEVAGRCGPDDEFLVYFSGHGVLDAGHLFLLLDATREPVANSALRASWVMDVLKQSNARNRILILDCCHAGAVGGWKDDLKVSSIVPTAPSLSVLCASERLERARELESLKGSFLTHEICNILGTKSLVSVTSLIKLLQVRFGLPGEKSFVGRRQFPSRTEDHEATLIRWTVGTAAIFRKGFRISSHDTR
jgi:hypothetical protein